MNVDYIYKRVLDLSAKDRSGYIDPNEFNRNLRDSENLLYDFYLMNYDKTKREQEALNPFIEKERISQVNGSYPHPNNYRRNIGAMVSVVSYEECDGEPKEKLYPADELKATEFTHTITSTIRSPSLKRKLFRLENLNGFHKVLPEEFKGDLILKYLRYPIYGEWVGTLNEISQEFEYDATSSTQLEWNVAEESDLIDLILFHVGIQIRETELLSWAAAKKSVSLNNN